jgi:serine/threonine-protein kinase HipA
VKKLAVHYCGWGEDWPLGLLADDGTNLLFEYSPDALSQGLVLSPLHLGLRAQAYGNFPDFLNRLPGLVADSLPDGWGLLLMDRLFRKYDMPHPGPLDCLAFIGNRGMGALRYEPVNASGEQEPDWNLLTLAQESERVLAGDTTAALRELAVAGGSPQGARPKALVQYDAATGNIRTRTDAAGTPWLIKFPAQREHREVCAIEQLYAELARDCGIDVPESICFEFSPRLAAFGAARFDREKGMRVPVHSLAGLLHADFRTPGATHYVLSLRATAFLTRDRREVEKAYARAVFNVIFHNRDDHPKNFAWRLGQDRLWRLAPAYDLTFSEGPAGQHYMDICGAGTDITRDKLLQLANETDVSPAYAEKTIDRICTLAGDFSEKAKDFSIRRQTVQQIRRAIERCRVNALKTM